MDDNGVVDFVVVIDVQVYHGVAFIHSFILFFKEKADKCNFWQKMKSK